MRWMIIAFAVVFCFYGCAKKQAVQPSEGVEEVSILEEEEMVEVPAEEETTPAETPEEEVTLPPPEETPPVVEEEVTLPPPEEIPPVVEEEVVEAPPVVEEVPVIPPPVTPYVEAPRKVLGLRVQIFASSTEKGASKVANDARAAFSEGVYVEHEAPYYKVRIGDCLSKDEAGGLRAKAVRLGYRGAFVVETQVNLR